MIVLENQTPTDNDYKGDTVDLLRMQKALFKYRGIFITLDEAANIWQTCSWNLAASWLIFPDENISIVKQIEGDERFISYEKSINLE